MYQLLAEAALEAGNSYGMTLGDFESLRARMIDINLCCNKSWQDCFCIPDIPAETIYRFDAGDVYAPKSECMDCWHFMQPTCDPLRHAVKMIEARQEPPLVVPCGLWVRRPPDEPVPLGYKGIVGWWPKRPGRRSSQPQSDQEGKDDELNEC